MNEAGMTKINVIHLMMGGLLAGVIVIVVGGVVWELILADEYLRQLGQGLPRRAIPASLVAGYLIGIMAVWLYASIRAHYGSGPKTAVIAGVVIWMVGYAMPNYAFWYSGILGGSLMALKSGIGLVEFILATLAGAWIYDRPGRKVAPVEPGVSA